MNLRDEMTADHQVLREQSEHEPLQSPGSRALDPVQRQEFWIDTCREVTRMRKPSKRVLELYRAHGCRFHEPTRTQVQQVLEALDSALPHWEQEHAALFYQTLELNFRELLRRA